MAHGGEKVDLADCARQPHAPSATSRALSATSWPPRSPPRGSSFATRRAVSIAIPLGRRGRHQVNLLAEKGRGTDRSRQSRRSAAVPSGTPIIVRNPPSFCDSLLCIRRLRASGCARSRSLAPSAPQAYATWRYACRHDTLGTAAKSRSWRRGDSVPFSLETKALSPCTVAPQTVRAVHNSLELNVERLTTLRTRPLPAATLRPA